METANQEFTVVLEGGSPWGFALQGGLDHRSPLRIGKVTAGGRAAKSGLLGGDYILAINGQPANKLKHLQAQQLIKKSQNTVELHCTKVRPWLNSPAVTSNPPPTFSFPVLNGNRTSSTKIKVPYNSPLKQAPTSDPLGNGHARSGSLGTTSESATTGASTPSPLSSIDVYDAKFTGMEYNTGMEYSPPGNTDDISTEIQEIEKVMDGIKEEVKTASIDGSLEEKNDKETSSLIKTTQEVSSLQGSSGVFSSPRGSIGEGSPPDKPRRRSSQRNSFSKRDFADILTQAAQARVRSRESSTDKDDVTTQLPPVQAPPQQSVQQQPPPPPSFAPPKLPPPVIKPTLTKKKDVTPQLLSKEPGWYHQMFQTFTNQVEQSFPGAASQSTEDQDVYVYDHRGLKVRKSSLIKNEIQEEKIDEARQNIPSPEAPVYVYDYRGLRVPVKAGSHIRGGSTPAVMEGSVKDQTQGTKFISVSSGGTTSEDVIFRSKRPTLYKSQHYSTDSSRGYWKQKDKDHIEFDKKRRQSFEQIVHRRSSSSDYIGKMTSMHPLLRANDDQEKSEPQPEKDEPNLFSRIDPNKLQGALNNASVLGALEKEGVPSHLLPALAQSQAAAAAQEQENKKLKPPPAQNAQANFDFEGKTGKELSFKKGDILELTHTVDDNWLEGSLDGTVGIFPKNYIRVLSASEYEELIHPKPQSIKQQVRALYDFQGQTEREVGFSKGDILTVDKKIDDNWYSGYHGEVKGIFPISYVELVED